ncbi:MAG: biotin--[acetyl-CoA-carboxylase] ligase [Pseudomonadota bacterium]
MIQIETVEETGSTNADLISRIQSGEAISEGYWLRAKRQSGGRGRLGRKWESPEGNLYCSTVAQIQADDPLPHTLSFVTAIAVANTLKQCLSDDALMMLKWPNDALVRGAKIAGILLERCGESVIVGIGLNVVHAPEVPGHETTSILVENPEYKGGAEQVLSELAANFAQALCTWREEGLAVTLDQWTALAHPIGTRLSLSPGGDEPVSGEFAGLDANGALQLRLANGAMRTIHAGDVTMIAQG